MFNRKQESSKKNMKKIKKFLESMFGPFLSTVWKEIAEELNASFIEGGIFSYCKIIFKHKIWDINLTLGSKKRGKHSVTTTKFSVVYKENINFNLRLYEEDFLSPVGKFFGMQDLEIGDSFFDAKYIIKSNNLELVKAFFANEEIKKILHSKTNFDFKIKDQSSWNSSTLIGFKIIEFEIEGVMKSRRDIKMLFMFFTLVLDRLEHLGVANTNFSNQI